MNNNFCNKNIAVKYPDLFKIVERKTGIVCCSFWLWTYEFGNKFWEKSKTLWHTGLVARGIQEDHWRDGI